MIFLYVLNGGTQTLRCSVPQELSSFSYILDIIFHADNYIPSSSVTLNCILLHAEHYWAVLYLKPQLKIVIDNNKITIYTNTQNHLVPHTPVGGQYTGTRYTFRDDQISFFLLPGQPWLGAPLAVRQLSLFHTSATQYHLKFPPLSLYHLLHFYNM